MKVRILTGASVISSGLFLIAAWNAAICQYADNEFGPPGLHTIGGPQPLYIDHMWYGVIPFAILPVAWVVVAIRRRHRWLSRETTCFTCGYNLTGNTSGTCPECGTPVPNRPETIA